MPYFDHIACTALEQLSARAHPPQFVISCGLVLVFRGEPTTVHLHGVAPPSPASAAGVSDDVH